MSEDFSNNRNAKFSNENSTDYYQQIKSISENSEIPRNPYDHIYASNSEIETHKQKLNCQSAESEVRFLKEWLLLHLDLIQQQNEEILSKERTILIIQQENEMLKERLSCMERGIPQEIENQFPTHTEEIDLKEEAIEDMTQSLGSCEDNDNKDPIGITVNGDNVDNTALDLKLQYNYNNITNDKTKVQTCESIDSSSEYLIEQTERQNTQLDSHADVKIESDTVDNFNSSVTYNFSSELDSIETLKMSIRRKRVCSNSSALSQNGSATDEKKTVRRIRKKRKRSLKDNQILTTPDLYVNQYGDPSPGCVNKPEVDPEVLSNSVLEVPRWRVKVYASCYSMEGTENLDDEVFLRRHNRLEIDERRRKRWDVQRIREQRVIEKLKQRQERIDSHSKIDNTNEIGLPFWPTVDDIKFIEICNDLPVSAFGVPIPKLPPSEFSLPWLNNSVVPLKKEKLVPKKTPRKRRSKR